MKDVITMNTVDFGDNVCCPICSNVGQRVRSETLKEIIKEHKLPANLDDYNLCLSNNCDVVYFEKHIFYKKDVKVKIWFKETNPPIPICYCKNVTREQILNHIVNLGCCTDLKDIQEHTGANTGRECLHKNPAGT